MRSPPGANQLAAAHGGARIISVSQAIGVAERRATAAAGELNLESRNRGGVRRICGKPVQIRGYSGFCRIQPGAAARRNVERGDRATGQRTCPQQPDHFLQDAREVPIVGFKSAGLGLADGQRPAVFVQDCE